MLCSSSYIRIVPLLLIVAAVIYGASIVTADAAFVLHAPPRGTNAGSHRIRLTTTALFAGKKGFGKGSSFSSSSSSSSSNNESPVTKTYGADTRPIRDLIDAEAAMQDFFTSREEWLPLFRSMVMSSSSPSSSPSSSCPAMEFLGGSGDSDSSSSEEAEAFDFHETSSPWRLLQAIPDQDDHRAILATFLDDVQSSLISIPVDEAVEEDENDLQFVEEGRRLLALSRFHVLQENSGGSGVETYDDLFATCWSELHHLSSQDEEHTGSLIILPDYELSDLRRFADMNVLRPLEWLGLHMDFEVASIGQGSSPAIRLLYKLEDIPEIEEPEVEEGGESPTSDEDE